MLWCARLPFLFVPVLHAPWFAAWVVSMVETDIHVRATPKEHVFCKELLNRFAKICYTIHTQHFKTKQARNPPPYAIMLYGPVGTHPRNGFTSPTAASLMTSLPPAARLVRTPEGCPIQGGFFDFRKAATEAKTQDIYDRLSVSRVGMVVSSIQPKYPGTRFAHGWVD